MESQTEKEVLQERRRKWLKKSYSLKKVPVNIRKKVEIMCVQCGNTWAKDSEVDVSCPHCKK